MKYVHFASANIVDGSMLVCSGNCGHTGNIYTLAFVEAVSQFWDKKLILADEIVIGLNVKAA